MAALWRVVITGSSINDLNTVFFDYGCLAGTENIAQTYESVAIKNDEALIILHRPMKALQC